jgi:hypothetical protein
MPLSPEHLAQLRASALTDEIIRQRGYCTFTEYRALRDLGFSEAQAGRTPALGIPLWNQRGEPYGWQIRPDSPRVNLTRGDLKGKKYELPRGARAHLDVHPSQMSAASDPARRLWITEGIKKGDSLAAQGECCIALSGVWAWRGSNKEGGNTALAGWHDVALNDRQVYIIFDNDTMRLPAVRAALEALHDYLTSRKAKVHLLFLPEAEGKLGIDDYLANGHNIEEVLALEARRMPQLPNAAQRKPGAPLLTLQPHELPLLVAQGLEALAKMPGAPRVFQRSRRLVVIAPAEPHAHGMERAAGAPAIFPVNAAMLRHLLAQAADWQSPGRSPGKFFPDKPANWLVETILNAEEWPATLIPPLTGLVCSPTLRPDGSLIDHQGYDPITGLYLHWEGVVFPRIPESPTRQDAQDALAILAEPFCDFLWAEPHHRSAFLAAILTLLGRFTVSAIPAFPVRSTVRGSGKSLLSDCVSFICLGKKASKWPETGDDEEERKRLFSIALDGDCMVTIDNVLKPFGSPALDQAITSASIKDRLLGTNQNKEASLNALFMVSGNNMVFRGDIMRRIVPIDLDPQCEHPEERTGFRYPDLEGHCLAQRRWLVAAGIIVLRAYFVAGCPPQGLTPYGSFEKWSDIIRSALVWAGEPDPCLGRREVEAISDEGYENHAELLNAWADCYPKATTLRAIQQDISLFHDVPRYQRLRDALGAYDQKYEGGKLNLMPIAKHFKRLSGRIIGGKYLSQLRDDTDKGKQWIVKVVSSN